MTFIRVAQLKSRVSLVVSLHSAFSGDTAYFSGITVWLEGVPAKPIAKADGFFVFGNLQEGSYRLHIASEHYFPETRDIEVHSSSTIEHVGLLPLPSYPFRGGATLLRVSAQDGQRRPVPDAWVEATVTQEDAVRARIAQDQQEAGSTELVLGAISGSIRVTDRYWVRSRSAKAFEEQVQIAGVTEHGRRVQLAHPLQHTYTRGAYLLPVVQTRTTARGEAVIAFSGIGLKQFTAQLRLRRADALQTDSVLKEVVLEEGKTVLSGSIII
ncbi:hypothetical protein [Paenibacillus rigui]|uniref:Carboxypeptidase regulatory-like domain-containing protein n=1 Tax=Paenibacillus rigui TaxID=554312 RepID=A0A229UNT4_9BACL|nr:hypothetical protein [Paenibacillus rigui]OXM85050.1 hypothetical protein CF651_17690 [Paenibacillus rigui]